jgi:hypothetical protein
MAMSYTTLTGAKTSEGSLKYWINYSKLDVGAALEDAQALIFQTLRVREMQAAATVSISSGSETAALPTGYLASLSMRDVTNNADLEHVQWEDLEQYRDFSSGDISTGKPCRYSVFNELFQFDTKADAAITARVLYYKSPDQLSGSNETNFLTTRYPHLLRAACLAAGYDQMRNTEAYTIAMQRMAAFIASINTQAEIDDHRGQFMSLRG